MSTAILSLGTLTHTHLATFNSLIYGSVQNDSFLQVRAFFDRQIEKLKVDGAFISDKIGDDHNRLVEEIFGTEDKNRDNIISFEEFSGPKHDEF